MSRNLYSKESFEYPKFNLFRRTEFVQSRYQTGHRRQRTSSYLWPRSSILNLIVPIDRLSRSKYKLCTSFLGLSNIGRNFLEVILDNQGLSSKLDFASFICIGILIELNQWIVIVSVSLAKSTSNRIKSQILRYIKQEILLLFFAKPIIKLLIPNVIRVGTNNLYFFFLCVAHIMHFKMHQKEVWSDRFGDQLVVKVLSQMFKMCVFRMSIAHIFYILRTIIRLGLWLKSIEQVRLSQIPILQNSIKGKIEVK